jgi:hypothetical protein
MQRPSSKYSGLKPKQKCGREENGVGDVCLQIQRPKHSDKLGITKLIEMAL